MSYLRTNYRKTGGLQDIAAIGGGILKASMFATFASAGGASTAATQGGAGTQYPYGGFLLISITAASGFADSNVLQDSTLGTMQSYYGPENVTSGYLFQPMGMQVLSHTYAAITAGAGISARVFHWFGFELSDSIWGISAIFASGSGSTTIASTTGIRALIWGMIISAP